MTFNHAGFKEAVKRRMLNQTELAEALGTTQQKVSQMLARNQRMRIEEITAIATACGFTREQLANFIEEN